jgi:hydroxymethylpyrimidine/phosphomethylpyrimidine kinase
MAEVVTPNIPEAEVLSGITIGSLDDMVEAGRRILELGPGVVLVKGGHLAGDESIDIAVSPGGHEEFRSPRLETRHTHGTGCTLASAIAACLAQGHTVTTSIRAAKGYLDGAIAHAPGVGGGHGPLGHFWRGYT